MKKNTTKKKWTLIFLLSAKNNLFNEQLKVIQEIYSVGSNKDVDFVILFDAIEGDKFSKKFTAPAIYHVDKNSDFLTDPSYYKLSSSAKGLTTKRNLEKLLTKTVQDFEAENFGFFYKGHGGPATTDISKGVFDTRLVKVDRKMKDEKIESKYSNTQPGWTFEGFCEYPAFEKSKFKQKPILLIYSKGNTISLTYSGMADVIDKVFKKKRPGFICLDCCWAQQIENANKFVGLTDYFIASPDEMPALGLGYTQLCKQFIQRPTIKSREVANLLVSIFYCTNYADYDCNVPEFRKMGVSLTSISLINFQSFIDPFTSLCSYLINKLKNKDDQTYLLIKNARSQCLDYTYKDTDKLKAAKIDYPMFNIDLVWWLENLLYYNVDLPLDNKIFEVINQLQNNIIAGFMGNNYNKRTPGSKAIGGNGIAICFPAYKEHANESILKDKKISFFSKTGWRNLLNEYYNYKLDKRKLTAKAGPVFKGLTLERSLAEDPERLIFKKAKN
ncbi:MAG: hypothetical protein E6H08_10720 [Bacteroidetes bacterium]|nr:MAG: hypothetical protein E6H08_10720 [Bacteroidota bacterium]